MYRHPTALLCQRQEVRCGGSKVSKIPCGTALAMARPKSNLTVPDNLLAAYAKQYPDVFNPEAHRVLFALRAVAQRVNDRANEWLAPLGLTVGKYNYLTALGSAPDHGLTLNDIAALIHTKSATVTQMIAALEHDGLVKRSNNPLDGRSTIAILTAAGKRLLRKAMVTHHTRIEESMKTVSGGDRRALITLLLKIGDAFAGTPEAVRTPVPRARSARATAK
jgi:DNA-binding MarR family transcriptional regulator